MHFQYSENGVAHSIHNGLALHKTQVVNSIHRLKHVLVPSHSLRNIAKKTILSQLINKPSWLFWPYKLSSVPKSLFLSEFSAGFQFPDSW